jgi:alkylation response protein AidB-like acyl-CoA dehydrogenase
VFQDASSPGNPFSIGTHVGTRGLHMNFDWTAEERRMRDSVLHALGESQDTEAADLPELKKKTVALMQRLSATRYLEIGTRSETMALMAAQEVLSRVSGSMFLSVEVTARLFRGVLVELGNSGPASEILACTGRGEVVGAVASSESPEQPTDHPSPTIGIPDGTIYLLSGKKSFVTNGPIADWIAVTGEVGDESAVFIVQAQQSGVTIGPRIRTVGYDGIAASAVTMNQVAVPAGLVLGPFGDRNRLGFMSAAQDRILTMASVGLMQRTIDAAQSYAVAHVRNGKPIFNHQEIRFKLAEMLTMAQTAQLLAFRAGWLHSVSDTEAGTVIYCAKVFAAEAAEQVASMAMQIMAGHGYVRDNPVEQAYRDAKFSAVAGTTSELARMAIADNLLKRNRAAGTLAK